MRVCGSSQGDRPPVRIKLDGNRPISITDDAEPQTVYGAMEFVDGANLSTEYYYDGNGSLVADANKGIAMIEYDNLNHPKRIQFTNGNTIEYVYAPDGQKLRIKYQTATGNVVVPLNTVQTITAATTTQTDYVGNLVYTATASGSTATPVLNKILYPDGYFTVSSGTGGDFRYFSKDHLGNNRVVTGGSTVYQRTHYYPFGGPYADVGTAPDYQPYKYNGKELDRMHGLDLYDYGFRHYDPIVPMFTQQDPMAEKYYHLSPYAYCGGNPVKYIDLDGRKIYIPKQFQSKVLEMINSFSKTQYKVNEKGYMCVDKDAAINEKGSNHYSERIDATIAAKGRLTIMIGDKYTANGITSNIEKTYGGGLTTINKKNKADIKTVVTGKDHIVHDTNGNELKKTGGEVLIHEIVGHAAPVLAGSETGNEVDNENVVRKELGLQEREREENHEE